ncbi:MAG TPA: hypothetical protein VIC29_07465 [Steroidobacteraceae bacterium]|jgi:regulator of protease activity HflC (stomatin/prohibitin superfamily)
MLAFLAAAIAVGYWVDLYLGLVLLAVGLLIGSSLKVANVWQKFVILRLGKLQSVRGAGLFAIIPVLDSVIAIIDASGTCTMRRRPPWPSPITARPWIGSHRPHFAK